jgi:predicted PurR-regulated permease PerM
MSDQLPEAPDELGATEDGANMVRAPSNHPRLTVTITSRTMWVAFGIVLVMLALLLLVIKALSALLMIFLSITLAEAIRPLVARLQRHRIPQPLAVILIYLGGATVLGGLLWLLFNPVLSDESAFATQLPTAVTRLQTWFAELQHTLSAYPEAVSLLGQVSVTLATWARHLLSALISVPIALLTGLIGFIIDAVIILTLTLFWLSASARFKMSFVELFGPDKRQVVSTVTTKISRSLAGWVVGTLVAMFLIGSLTTLGLAIVGAPYALLLGILAGLTEFIPYLGPWISGTIAALVTLGVTGNPVTVIWVIIVFLFIQEVEGNVVEPLVMHRAVQLDPWLVLVAIVIGGELLGLAGVILAVPIAAVIQVVMLEVVTPAIRRATHQQGKVSSPAA